MMECSVSETTASALRPPWPERPGRTIRWRGLHGACRGLAITLAARRGPTLVITKTTQDAQQIEEQVRFFADSGLPVAQFPDWETLPYDIFSPHQDIVSERLATLAGLPGARAGVIIAPITTLMLRTPPRAYVDAHALLVEVGDQLEVAALRGRLNAAGYRCVGQVMEHGEYAVRGSLIDVFPMGSARPLRIDLLDEAIDTIRYFDADTQRSTERVNRVRVLPAREFPLDETAVARFRQAWRAHFAGDPTRCATYRDVSQGMAPPGIEYYLPLFFETTATLFDFLPPDTLVIEAEGVHAAADAFWSEVQTRHEARRHDPQRPILDPREIYAPTGEVYARAADHPRIRIEGVAEESSAPGTRFATRTPVAVPVDARAREPLAALRQFIHGFAGRVLIVAESAGRRETLTELLGAHGLRPAGCANWSAFLACDDRLALTVAPLDTGAVLGDPSLALLTESELFGERVVRRRKRRGATRDAETIVRDLAELAIGAPVVHEDHGVGRYRGLVPLELAGVENEFLCIEYAEQAKLYVPVASLHLVSRYTGADPECAPLHRLGGSQWQKVRRRAARRVHDVAAELLEVQARRAARPGHPFQWDPQQLTAFEQGFPFEPTLDQQSSIEAVLEDLRAPRPMDRLVCGDVGFGKTEIALRAAFAVVEDGRQVVVLVPTTLLAQQHYQTFSDRFADWPVRIEQLSRFRSRAERDAVMADLANGRIDIVIGTHGLLRNELKPRRLGLVIIDEEHRFGVRQKERLKRLRADTDVLTLTATPIPRTLNMAIAGLRDMSIIATPPQRRLAIKTFVRQWDSATVREACLRELHRGGQIYMIHNKVETIERTARALRELVPEARIEVGHGQMRERELERVMLDFYHHRFHILVCTTIIETGIDVPTANTMIINRADRFGLAQLHQLRGRIGRSHHRAYAYLMVPDRRAMSADSIKRLEAIESLGDLGIGFTLATHDLEIRGAGELLGEEQSGQIQEVGYTLYARMLDRAVAALKAGRSPALDRPLDHGTEVDLHLSARIP